MKVELVSMSISPLLTIVNAARVTSGKYPLMALEFKDDSDKLVKRLIELGHESILEFAWFCFYVEGISRVCLAQLTRHRLFSFAVESQRRSKVKKEFVLPDALKSRDDVHDFIYESYQLYEKLLNDGVPLEDARYILPQSCTCKAYIAGNLRQWRHFVRLRDDKESQWEIRELAKVIKEKIALVNPVFMYFPE